MESMGLERALDSRWNRVDHLSYSSGMFCQLCRRELSGEFEITKASPLSVNNAYDHLRALMFYPMSACLMIFGNLILSPLDPRTAEDLTLLDSTASLIRGLPTHSRSVHMKRLVDLVTELSGLAKLAVSEARTDQFLFLT